MDLKKIGKKIWIKPKLIALNVSSTSLGSVTLSNDGDTGFS